MLAIQSNACPASCTPHILPCQIHHTGPAKVTKRFWAPRQEQGIHITHFRGRRLKGRRVNLPSHYRGILLQHTGRALPQTPSRPVPGQPGEDNLSDDDLDDASLPVRVLEEVGSFKDMLVWGHDQTPAADDVFVKGVEEWIGFAESIHASAGAASAAPAAPVAPAIKKEDQR